MESALGSNPPVLSFEFLCKGSAPSFGTKSTPLVSWFPFLCEQHQRRQNEKSKIRNWHAESGVARISYFECAHYIYIYVFVARLSEGPIS